MNLAKPSHGGVRQLTKQVKSGQKTQTVNLLAKLTDLPEFHTIPVNDIVIGDRFRVDLDGTGAQSIDYLVESIRKANKLFHPIVVERTTNTLLAGGRRLAAVIKLGWPEVSVHFLDELTPIARREVELEENLARKNLTWQEQVKLTAEIDKIKRSLYGNKGAGRRPSNDPSPEASGWSLRKTAELRNVPLPTVSEDIRLAAAIEVLPSLDNERSRENALRKKDHLVEDIEREIERRQRLNDYTQYDSCVKCGDATSLILNIPTESIDCIITDPPYGLDVGHGGGHRMEADFDDSPEAALAVIRTIAPQLRRVLKPSGHFYTFFGPALWAQVIPIWRNAGFEVRDLPSIWVKPGGATGTTDWDHNFAPSWEPFLFASNRQRRLNFKRKNVFTFSVELGNLRQHPTQKPIELLRELIQISTDVGDVILDPFAGVLSTAVAASQLRRKFYMVEQNTRYVQIGLQRLVNEGKERPFVKKEEL